MRLAAKRCKDRGINIGYNLVAPGLLLRPVRRPSSKMRHQRVACQRTFPARANALGQPARDRLPPELLLKKQREGRKREEIIDDPQIEKRMAHLHRAVRYAGIFEFEHLRPMRR